MKKALYFLAVFVAAGITASAASITNGNFATCTGTTVAGWTLSGNDGFVCEPSGGGVLPIPSNSGPGGSGNWILLNNGPGQLVTASQMITGLTVGSVYTLNWSMRSGYGCCAAGNGPGAGVVIDTLPASLFAIQNNTTWTNYSVTFTATAASENLTLESQANGSDTDAGFANVSVVSAIPEPSTLLLLGAGAGLIAFRRLRLS